MVGNDSSCRLGYDRHGKSLVGWLNRDPCWPLSLEDSQHWGSNPLQCSGEGSGSGRVAAKVSFPWDPLINSLFMVSHGNDDGNINNWCPKWYFMVWWWYWWNLVMAWRWWRAINQLSWLFPIIRQVIFGRFFTDDQQSWIGRLWEVALLPL